GQASMNMDLDLRFMSSSGAFLYNFLCLSIELIITMNLAAREKMTAGIIPPAGIIQLLATRFFFLMVLLVNCDVFVKNYDIFFFIKRYSKICKVGHTIIITEILRDRDGLQTTACLLNNLIIDRGRSLSTCNIYMHVLVYILLVHCDNNLLWDSCAHAQYYPYASLMILFYSIIERQEDKLCLNCPSISIGFTSSPFHLRAL
ncbi:hypothetical protein ACJX0J_019050, partial [Zea mays]